MFDIKKAKEKAIQIVKKHYVLLIILCLIAAFLGSAYSGSLTLIQRTTVERVYDAAVDNTTYRRITADDVFVSIIKGQLKEGEEVSQEIIDSIESKKILGVIELGNARGALSSLVNSISSGQFVLTIIQTIATVVNSESIAIDIAIILAACLILAVTIFLKDTYRVAFRRSFLEAQNYEEVKFSSLFFILRVKKFIKASFTIFLTSVYQFLWDLTIVGGIIKKFSYYMVPYIVAENPNIDAKKAIKLSQDMMNGHKWECFKVELSFILWWILGTVTFGLSELVFSNAFKEATMVEYYKYIRGLAKENNIENAELLNDKYLYEKADEKLLKKAYSDIVEIMEDDIVLENYKHKGFRGFIEDNLGLIYKYDKEEDEYNVAIEQEEKIEQYKDVLVGKQYPERLLPNYQEEVDSTLENVHYLRHYSIWSVVVLFFVFCFIGYSWEVALHLVEDGVFVNRGTLHGPWLPIYGSGGVLILMFLYRFRNNIGKEAVSAIILCGIVEYASHWFLEVTRGTKWWDYSGYFLNINGRICAEGLLVFMLGGLAIVYLVAPRVDNLVRKANQKILIPICVILLLIFTGDVIYSSSHPNTGKGITDYDDVVYKTAQRIDNI